MVQSALFLVAKVYLSLDLWAFHLLTCLFYFIYFKSLFWVQITNLYKKAAIFCFIIETTQQICMQILSLVLLYFPTFSKFLLLSATSTDCCVITMWKYFYISCLMNTTGTLWWSCSYKFKVCYATMCNIYFWGYPSCSFLLTVIQRILALELWRKIM